MAARGDCTKAKLLNLYVSAKRCNSYDHSKIIHAGRRMEDRGRWNQARKRRSVKPSAASEFSENPWGLDCAEMSAPEASLVYSTI